MSDATVGMLNMMWNKSRFSIGNAKCYGATQCNHKSLHK